MFFQKEMDPKCLSYERTSDGSSSSNLSASSPKKPNLDLEFTLRPPLWDISMLNRYIFFILKSLYVSETERARALEWESGTRSEYQRKRKLKEYKKEEKKRKEKQKELKKHKETRKAESNKRRGWEKKARPSYQSSCVRSKSTYYILLVNIWNLIDLYVLQSERKKGT